MARRLHIVATTLPSAQDAERIAGALVGERLAVCAQIGATVRSRYRWQGELEDRPETPLVLKVRHDRLEACVGSLQALHPYETPEILAWPAETVDPGYLAWAYGEDGA
ncbi:MAG TPA: divalent-cation tolerance protein CutA [Candidatus Krumholzibacteria bacterium]|nr:divalent-cation tolerance protein CutA [Candidatus Krumholzibacteria bacterium]HPD71433.1 divalent-cation tolerance protein CutA [Candidatus Krumholzibacteria bacterium]HRY41634.1 divalent-cation tolerance protein CutA [Candidatus Krumholzibacteria bacterium]